MIRFALAAVVVGIAVMVAPEAQAPAFNSADLIVVAAPFALVAVFAWPRPRDHRGGDDLP